MAEQAREPDGEWLPPVVAGRALGVSALRVKQLVADGRLTAVRTPLGRLIDPASVEALARERAAKRGPAGGR